MRWPDGDLSPAEAVALQRTLARRVVRRGRPRIRDVAGVDCAFSDDGKTCHAAAVVWRVGEHRVLASATASVPCRFPYVPGLLSFRELPAILAALDRLDCGCDAVMCDGQGIAHPRRLGIASHLGLVVERPTIGCAKSRLVGEYAEPGWRRGSRSVLRDGDESIGAVLRTRDRVRPLFVSIGHRIGLDEAVAVVLACDEGYRLPAPTRRADHEVRIVKRALRTARR